MSTQKWQARNFDEKIDHSVEGQIGSFRGLKRHFLDKSFKTLSDFFIFGILLEPIEGLKLGQVTYIWWQEVKGQFCSILGPILLKIGIN